ncbi:uncharacterized protein isoform X2 [Rhodnius prolixus]
MSLLLIIPCLWIIDRASGAWECPSVTDASCSCDLPHTLRCVVDQERLPILARTLSQLKPSQAVTLLDCTVRDLSNITEPLFQGVSLDGLVISSGILSSISAEGFSGLSSGLEALGLPNNQLKSVPTSALSNLRTLSRLDLSHNLLRDLHEHSFKGLSMLRYLVLSSNQLEIISNCTFCNLSKLKFLRLQNNRLGNEILLQLDGLLQLEELDLGNNRLSGALNWHTFPHSLSSLKILHLAHNQFCSIAAGAFQGMQSLTHLILRYNVLEVVEDDAFKAVGSLVDLDLAHNRIIAVSEGSLAHLSNLKRLDLSHNFLRALSADLTFSLKSLTELRLDDNDISIVASEALHVSSSLRTLTLTDNPLNCDCSLTSLANWLKSENITPESRNSAVCATPPSLENGLALQVSLQCEEYDLPPQSSLLPISGSRVTLTGVTYATDHLLLLWSVKSNHPYTCDAVFVYEELGSHELLLQTNRLTCSSELLPDPTSLPLSILAPHLQIGHRYRYCVVMIEKGLSESALVLGCSKVLKLAEKTKPVVIHLDAQKNASDVLVKTSVWPENLMCQQLISVTVGRDVKRKLVNCSQQDVRVIGMPFGKAWVCVGIIGYADAKNKCVWSRMREARIVENVWSPPRFITSLGLAVISTGLIAISAYYFANLFRQTTRPAPTSPLQNNQCHHTSYVLLHATTNL